MIQDSFMVWPYPTQGVQGALDDGLHQAFERSALAQYLNQDGGDLAEFVALVCDRWNVNPWLLVAFGQREQSTFTTKPADFKQASRMAWLGFVGQDVGRASGPGWYGVYTQVQRAMEQTAWLMGVEPAGKWPPYIHHSTERWPHISPMSVTDTHENPITYTPQSMWEYVLLTYTPHIGKLATTEMFARSLSPKHFFGA